MSQLKEQLDRLKAAVRSWRTWQAPPQLTEKEHQKRIEDAKAVMELMQQPGWRVYEERARAELLKQQDDAFDMEPSFFRSARGLQAKGEVIGGKRMLNIVARIITDGMASEAILEKWAKESDAEIARRERLKKPRVL